MRCEGKLSGYEVYTNKCQHSVVILIVQHLNDHFSARSLPVIITYDIKLVWFSRFMIGHRDIQLV